MQLTEELIVYLLDDRTHRIHVEEWTRKCVVGGAVLMDLILAGRVTLEPDPRKEGSNIVSVKDASITENEYANHVLSAIQNAPKPESVAFWVEQCAVHGDELLDGVLSTLCRNAIIQIDEDRNYAISDDIAVTGRYPESARPAHSSEFARNRLLGILLGKHEPTLGDIALISLADVCGELQRRLTPDQMDKARSRINEVSAPPVADIVAGVRSCLRSDPAPRKGDDTIPTARIRELLSPTFRRGEPARWFAELSVKYGPVFSLPGPGSKQVVIVGAEANRWFEHNGWNHTRARDYIAGYERAFGCPGTVVGADGPDHAHLRRLAVKRGPIALLEDRIQELFSICRQHYARWTPGERHSAGPELYSLMGNILGKTALGIDAEHLISDLIQYDQRAVKAEIMGIVPRVMMRTPGMRRTKKKLDQLVDEIIRSRPPGEQRDSPKDMVDDLLLQHRADPYAMPFDQLPLAIVGVLVASQNLGNLLSFALYELIRQPTWLEAIRAEADALFDAGDPEAAHLRSGMIGISERFFMEVCRLHPVLPGSVRTVKNGFEMYGKWIEPGTSILIAFAAPHFLEDHYKDADRFDPDRFTPERAEHLPPGVYSPFGCDGHRCPMHPWTRLLMIVNILLLAHHLNLQCSPVNYVLRKKAYPQTAPNRKFRFSVESVRRPLQKKSE